MEFPGLHLIDGGLSNVLEEQGCNLNHHLWSARLLSEDPQQIVQAHLSYLEAGARCIITSSYQASIPGFEAAGFSREQGKALLNKTVALAEEARTRFQLKNPDTKIAIAASIGPYGAYLADGSEYRGNYGISASELSSFHQERLQILDQTSADFFACETIPSLEEVAVLAKILKECNKPAWVSFSCKNDRQLNDGPPIEQAIELLLDHPKVFALGVNCTAPKHISALIKRMKRLVSTQKIIVYPNSGETYHADSKTWVGISDPSHFVSMALEWKSLGADMIGGCCRIGPKHIRLLADNFPT